MAEELPPIFDREGLLHRASDDPEVVEEVLNDLRQSLPKRLEVTRAAIAAGDRSRLREIVHSIKGSTLTAGALRVYQIAEKFQRAAEATEQPDDDTEIASLFDKLSAAIDEFIAEISP